jgi:hypothetical protein
MIPVLAISNGNESSQPYAKVLLMHDFGVSQSSLYLHHRA